MDWLSSIRSILDLGFPFLEQFYVGRAILGVTLVFFLPGFAWTLVFFRGKQINALERVALSVGLSIAIVILSILFLNKALGMGITGANAVLVIVVAIIVPVIIYAINRRVQRD